MQTSELSGNHTQVFCEDLLSSLKHSYQLIPNRRSGVVYLPNAARSGFGYSHLLIRKTGACFLKTDKNLYNRRKIMFDSKYGAGEGT